MKRDSARWGRAGAVLLLGLWAGCPGAKPVAGPGDGGAASRPGFVTADPLAQLRWLPVRPPLGVALLEAPAQVLVAPESTAEVSPTFRARVVGLAVRAGQRVKAGDAVATVLSPEVSRSAGSYVGATLRLEAYERRRQQLLGLRSEGLMRLADLAESEAQVAEARATQQEALATLRAGGIGGAEAAGLLGGGGLLTLRSPLAGIVTAVRGTIGQLWEPGAAALCTIVGSGETRIEARLSLQLSQPELFAAARFTLVLLTGSRYPLRLLDRAPTVDSRDGTTLAWFVPQATADGTTPSLPFGLSGKVEMVPSATRQPGGGSLVVVATRALWLKPEQTVVLRRRSGGRAAGSRDAGSRDAGSQASAVETVAVTVLASSSTDALLRAELAPGEELLAEPSLQAPQLGDGMGR